MRNDDFDKLKGVDPYEPTEEEWNEIQDLISEEEEEEWRHRVEEDNRELHLFKMWLKSNGMRW